MTKNCLSLFLVAALVASPVMAQTQEDYGLPNTAHLAVCNANEWPTVNGQPYWVEIQCNWNGSRVGNVHSRVALRFDGGLCQPWLVIINLDNTVTIYCSPRD